MSGGDKMRIHVDWSRCDGNGVCAGEAPALFSLDDEDQLHVLQQEFGPDLKDAAEAAVRGCPKRALRLER